MGIGEIKDGLKIIIPAIQRDYAQGRDNAHANRVRERFLQALYEGLDKEITLDFVYGNVEEVENKGKIMTPLDGQQRLTTLFLIYWYAAQKDNIEEKEYSFLKNFNYETRYSAREFCKELVKFKYNPSLTGGIEKAIKNQGWFALSWQKDPTVSSMLVMLTVIEKKFCEADNLWQRLENIKFYFLPIEEMGLSDELYIKMNSRGRALTPFENFKAEFEGELKIIEESLKAYGINSDVNNESEKGWTAEKVLENINDKWTTLLWEYVKDNSKIKNKGGELDSIFLRYIRFVCDIIYYKYHRRGKNPKGRVKDELEIIKRYFSCKIEDDDLDRILSNNFESDRCEKTKNIWEQVTGSHIEKDADVKEHIILWCQKSEKVKVKEFLDGIKVWEASQNVMQLNNYFNCWCNIENITKEYKNPEAFFESFITDRKYKEGYIIINHAITDNKDIDVLADCFNKDEFSLGRMIFLYAVIQYLLQIQKGNTITKDDFLHRIRIVNNLIKNSDNEIADRTNKSSNIPNILKQIDCIIGDGVLSDYIAANFNRHQYLEEKAKLEYLNTLNGDEKAGRKSKIFELEDHLLLKGQVSIIVGSSENRDVSKAIKYCDKFYKLFEYTDKYKSAPRGKAQQAYNDMLAEAKKSRDLIDCAMMSICDYGQDEGNGWRYQYASYDNDTAWENLFHQSANKGFDNTSKTLLKLLDKCENNNLEQIIYEFIAQCEKESKYPWRYYYVKYNCFRPGSYGKVWKDNNEEEQGCNERYVNFVMKTNLYTNPKSTYLPYFKVIVELASNWKVKDDNRRYIWWNKKHIEFKNDKYVLKNDRQEIIKDIDQDDAGVDKVNRIELLKKFIEVIEGL